MLHLSLDHALLLPILRECRDNSHLIMNTWITNSQTLTRRRLGTTPLPLATLMMAMADTSRAGPMLTGISKFHSFVIIHVISVNVAKRVHSNDLEHITVMLPLSLLTGLVFPYPTTALLANYFLGRQFYTSGYFKRDGAFATQRMIGSAMCNISHVGVMGLALYCAVQLRRGRIGLLQ